MPIVILLYRKHTLKNLTVGFNLKTSSSNWNEPKAKISFEFIIRMIGISDHIISQLTVHSQYLNRVRLFTEEL
jgi:hypothetical protein